MGRAGGGGVAGRRFKISLFEFARRQWPPEKLIWFEGKSDFDPTAECKFHNAPPSSLYFYFH